ncbi:hypothetical protein AB7714_28345 [Tardiphaga sp. 1201_B9_N1_1]|uniref:hypothetical protein n=1 Tax=unclassified Tardiphaga TaxID=2631404 RepID=UPI003F220D27
MVDFLSSYFDPRNFEGVAGLLNRQIDPAMLQLQPGLFPPQQLQPVQQPVAEPNQPSPLDAAQWPAGPAGAPQTDGASLPRAAQPTAGIMQAPLSLAPPSPAPEAPGVGDRISDGLSRNSNMLISLGAGIAQGGIGKGLQAAMTGVDADRKQGNQNLTQQALIKKGLDPEMARAVSANPALLSSVAGSLFKPQVRGLSAAEKTQAGLPGNLPWFVGADGKPFVPEGLAQALPSYGTIKKDEFGNEVMGWIDKNDRTTTPGQSAAAQPAPGASAIPPVPPGYDPKLWREKHTERGIADALPADAKSETQLRQEVQGLPSYKNMSQAAPVYRSMVDAAGRDNRAADVNLIYGMAKIMDPGSVVRESEMTVAQAIGTLPQRVQAEVKSQIEKTGRLTPELRQDIMQEAHSRMKSYDYQYQQDVDMTRGIAKDNRMNEARVIPSFGGIDEWKAPTAAPATPAAPAIQPKAGGNYMMQNGKLVPVR